MNTKTLCNGSNKPLGAFVIRGYRFGICQVCLRKFTKTNQGPGTLAPRHYLGTHAHG